MSATATERLDQFYPFAAEAVNSLGYIDPSHIKTVALLQSLCVTHHPRGVATKYRKRGEQLSREEKKALGLRSNAFYSREAFEALTDKGKKSPILAYENTLLRGSFSYFRSTSIASSVGVNHAYLKYSRMFFDCDTCAKLDGHMIQPIQADWRPPSDCLKDACGVLLHLRIDHLADLK